MLHGGSLLKPPCQRVGVTPLLKGIRNGGLDFVKAAVRLSVGHGDCLLNDGFFSFAVVRQIVKTTMPLCCSLYLYLDFYFSV